MKYRSFDKLGIECSLFGLGCMRFNGQASGDSVIDEEKAISLIRQAIDGGVTYLDTAYIYLDKTSETVLGKALKDGYRDKVTIATKMPLHKVNNYEDEYNNSDPIWVTMDEDISLYYESGYYHFNKYYKDMPVGNYVVRLTKTRKSEVSVAREPETVVTDAKVTVRYHVEAPSMSFTNFYVGNFVLSSREYMNYNYDDIDKYNYNKLQEKLNSNQGFQSHVDEV